MLKRIVLLDARHSQYHRRWRTAFCTNTPLRYCLDWLQLRMRCTARLLELLSFCSWALYSTLTGSARAATRNANRSVLTTFCSRSGWLGSNVPGGKRVGQPPYAHLT